MGKGLIFASNMKTAALFLLIASALVGANTLGADKCTWGPSYWCKSIREATECSALDHCIAKNWADVALESDSSMNCVLCKGAVEMARTFIFTDEFEKKVEESWQKLCSLIPNVEVKKACSTVGAQYLPQIIKLVESSLQPEVVCHLLGLCNQEEAPKVSLAYYPGVKTAQDCTDCNNFLVSVKGHVKDCRGPVKFYDDLEKVCGILGPYEDTCLQVVSKHAAEAYEYIVNILDPKEICDFSGMCDGSSFLTAPRFLLGEVCDDCKCCTNCKSFAADLSRRAQEKGQAKVEEDLKKMCKLAGPYGPQCEDLVAKNIDVLYDFLVNKLQPEEACKFITMCGCMDGKVAPPAFTLPELKLGDDCQDCIVFLADIVKMAKAKTQDQVEEDIKHLCSIVPSYEGLCKELIGQYIDKIYDYLVNKLDSVKICTFTGMCTA